MVRLVQSDSPTESHFIERVGEPDQVGLVQPEGVVGDEGKQDGEGNESVQPGNVCREERGQHLEKTP